jgi:hypothetical protein
MALCGFGQFSGLVGNGLLAGRDPKIQSYSNVDFIGVSRWRFSPPFLYMPSAAQFVNRESARCSSLATVSAPSMG